MRKYCKTNKNDGLNSWMKILYQQQIQSVIIEGGAFTLQKFIDKNLWDEAFIIKNENLKLENGTKAPKFNLYPFEIQKYRDNNIELYKNS